MDVFRQQSIKICYAWYEQWSDTKQALEAISVPVITPLTDSFHVVMNAGIKK